MASTLQAIDKFLMPEYGESLGLRGKIADKGRSTRTDNDTRDRKRRVKSIHCSAAK